MKKNLIFAGILLLSIQSIYAQLEVQSNNNVKIDRTMSIGTDRDPYARLNIEATSDEQYNTWYGVKAYIKTRNTMPTGPVIGLHGYVDGSPSLGNYPITPMVGVFGKAYMSLSASNRFSAGVVGVANTNSGIGVYGAVSSSYDYTLPTTNYGSYAGYFAGTTKVTGTMYASAFTTTSDSRLKENIRNLNDSAINNIQLLRPVEYQFKQDSVHYTYEKDAFEMKVNHYGLLAQEVQEIFPNLVYESGDGYLSINYTELIPVLIKSVQELSSEVLVLKAQLNELKAKKR